MLNNPKAYQILTTEVGQMPSPLPVGPPPLPPPPPSEEGYQVTAAPLMEDPIGNTPQDSYHVPDAYGGYIIFPESIALESQKYSWKALAYRPINAYKAD